MRGYWLLALTILLVSPVLGDDGCWGYSSACRSGCVYSSRGTSNGFTANGGCNAGPPDCPSGTISTFSGTCSSTGSGICYDPGTAKTVYHTCSSGGICDGYCTGSINCGGLDAGIGSDQGCEDCCLCVETGIIKKCVYDPDNPRGCMNGDDCSDLSWSQTLCEQCGNYGPPPDGDGDGGCDWVIEYQWVRGGASTSGYSSYTTCYWYDSDDYSTVCSSTGYNWVKAGEEPLGEYANKGTFECCGDDTGEYYVSSTYDSSTWEACCNDPSDCVFYNGYQYNCYPHGSFSGDVVCYNSEWSECASDSDCGFNQVCVGDGFNSYDHCSYEGQCRDVESLDIGEWSGVAKMQPGDLLCGDHAYNLTNVTNNLCVRFNLWDADGNSNTAGVTLNQSIDEYFPTSSAATDYWEYNFIKTYDNAPGNFVQMELREWDTGINMMFGYLINETGDVDGSPSTGCCDEITDCVDDVTQGSCSGAACVDSLTQSDYGCYDTGTLRDVNDDGLDELCSNGVWLGPDESQTICEGRGHDWVSGVFSAETVSLGAYISCIVLSDGSVSCWGYDNYGETSPPALTNAIDVSAGHEFACALLSDGSVSCWGRDNYGQVSGASSITNAIAISSGYNHACALLSDGSVSCWGDDGGYGRVNGASFISGALDISCGVYHCCALIYGDTIDCWGYDWEGLTSPPAVSNVVELSSGFYFSCALLSDGSVECWGHDSDSVVSDASSIVNAVGIGAGGWHSCALLSDGGVSCWGDNDFGQVSDAPSSANLVSVYSGYGRCYGLLPNGSLMYWGEVYDSSLRGNVLSFDYDPCCGDDGVNDLFYNGTLNETSFFCHKGSYTDQEIDLNQTICDFYDFVWFTGEIGGNSTIQGCCGDDVTADNFYNSSHYCYEGVELTEPDSNVVLCEWNDSNNVWFTGEIGGNSTIQGCCGDDDLSDRFYNNSDYCYQGVFYSDVDLSQDVCEEFNFVWFTGEIGGNSTIQGCCGDDAGADDFYNGSIGSTDHFCFNSELINEEIDLNQTICDFYDFVWFTGEIGGNSTIQGCCGDDELLEDFYNSSHYCYQSIIYDDGDGDQVVCEGWDGSWFEEPIDGFDGPCCGDDAGESFYNGSISDTEFFCLDSSLINLPIDESESACVAWDYDWFSGAVGDYAQCCGDDGGLDDFGNTTGACCCNGVLVASGTECDLDQDGNVDAMCDNGNLPEIYISDSTYDEAFVESDYSPSFLLKNTGNETICIVSQTISNSSLSYSPDAGNEVCVAPGNSHSLQYYFGGFSCSDLDDIHNPVLNVTFQRSSGELESIVRYLSFRVRSPLDIASIEPAIIDSLPVPLNEAENFLLTLSNKGSEAVEYSASVSGDENLILLFDTRERRFSKAELERETFTLLPGSSTIFNIKVVPLSEGERMITLTFSNSGVCPNITDQYSFKVTGFIQATSLFTAIEVSAWDWVMALLLIIIPALILFFKKP